MYFFLLFLYINLYSLQFTKVGLVLRETKSLMRIMKMTKPVAPKKPTAPKKPDAPDTTLVLEETPKRFFTLEDDLPSKFNVSINKTGEVVEVSKAYFLANQANLTIA